MNWIVGTKLLGKPSSSSSSSSSSATLKFVGDFNRAALLFFCRKNQPHSCLPPEDDDGDPFSFLRQSNHRALSRAIDAILQSFLPLRSLSPAPAFQSLLSNLLSSFHPPSLELALATLQCMIRNDCHPHPRTLPSLSVAWFLHRWGGVALAEALEGMRLLSYCRDGNTCNLLLESLCSVACIDEARVVAGYIDTMADSKSYHLMIERMTATGKKLFSLTRIL